MTAVIPMRTEVSTLPAELGERVPGMTLAPAGLLRPVASPAEVITSQEETRQLVEQALKKGRDYGEIPGVDKPTLLKPGAERICAGFGVFPRFRIVEKEIDHDREIPWVKRKKKFEGKGRDRKFVGHEEERGTSYGVYRYVIECELVHRQSGAVVGSCIASCSSMESKYIDRPRDSENTIVKMAEKRAHVGAVLLTFGLSEQFTQDVEDLPKETFGGAESTDETGRPTSPACLKCGGAMWDNRDKNLEREAEGKKRMPDFKCKDKTCVDEKGDVTVIWQLEEQASSGASEESPSEAQKEFFGKLLKSRVWTPEERERYEAQGAAATRGQMKQLIDEVSAEGHRRKAEQRAAGKTEGAEAAPAAAASATTEERF